jgi:ubiquinone/menaquinone biosynthesis C-methylase UbiE
MPDKSFLDGVYRDRSDEETRRYYDEWAHDYDREMDTLDYAQPRRCAEALVGLLPPAEGQTVLDIGCGTGRSGVALRAAGYATVDGCDYSEEMLRRAEATGAYRRLFQANLNAPPMDVADASFDAVTCVGVFSFGHVSPDAMDDILRVVRPGGPVVIGINEMFYDRGEVTAKLEALQDGGALEILSREKGEHLPGEGMSGWVIRLRRSA